MIGLARFTPRADAAAGDPVVRPANNNAVGKQIVDRLGLARTSQQPEDSRQAGGRWPREGNRMVLSAAEPGPKPAERSLVTETTRARPRRAKAGAVAPRGTDEETLCVHGGKIVANYVNFDR
jgi:hypothetical protein